MGMRSGLSLAFRAVANVMDPGRPQNAMEDRMWGSLMGGQGSVAGPIVTDRNASQLGAVQAVRNGLVSAMKSLPFSVYRRGDDGAREALPSHAVTRLIASRPGNGASPAEFIGEIAWWLSFYRNAYCRIQSGTVDENGDYYAVGGLEMYHPRRLASIQRGFDGHLYYTFNPPATLVQNSKLKAETFRDDEIWHLRSNPLQEDGLLGEPIFVSARDVFARAIAVHEYGDIWFANSGNTGGVLNHPGNFKDKDAERDFLDTWRSMSTGRNRHRDRLLKYGVKYEPLKVTNAEAQLLETEDAADTALFGLWSYPPHRAARLKRSTNNNIEQQSLDFVICCLAPLAIEIEQAIERDLLLDNADDKLFAEFNFAGLLRGDLLNRYRAYLIGRQGEWLSANDILRFENMPPRTDPGGDDYKNPLTKDPPPAAVTKAIRPRATKTTPTMKRKTAMANDNRAELRQVIAQITAVDPVVAIDLSAMSESLRSLEAIEGERAAAAATVAAQPGKIALIGVYGGLTPRGSWYGSSLSGIADAATRATNDPDIASAIVDIDSPGGTVAGTMEAAAAVADLASKKPCVACVNTLAASAAYWIASQASEIVMTPSADVGSIGAMIMHQDISGWLEQIGLKLTIIRSEQSPNKNEAHPFAPLSDDARAFLQSRADAAGSDFIKAVASGRKVSQTKVRETFGQGRVFGAKEAMARGMADRVATFGQVVAGLMPKPATQSVATRRRSALLFD